MATVRFFAAAAEAAATDGTALDAATIGDLRARLVARYGAEFERILNRCSLLVNGTRATDDAVPLAGSDAVDVLPPFAGG
ncbi:MoaD/ThiS family protein [Cryobacterium sp. TMT1-21]|uniref:MoaD/ThiS family protein n=1 Tax=Cryobacterium shii TaxID=1259235 RepID=A0AAQ2C8F4_9MICO|nr:MULTISPECIES: MoaD/ThiS family protein [Cryobacterium]TFC52140.1 MoaD/ThiS family protein [Cryobacterium shii]TFC84693.1 MoaD/ThiS family protein [Cryobacterium sp. TmT2-59]TFD15733.1 MoaD/ThiS family protein [Cryobacterium sp. TMT1-21]TFD19429.1 MoaD/ThiS family protein [Cryobacterium sp. TMT4-10]TFD26736.1 MoaD/ThiS family protein [Cryobacterium sp. TMT2-23]